MFEFDCMKVFSTCFGCCGCVNNSHDAMNVHVKTYCQTQCLFVCVCQLNIRRLCMFDTIVLSIGCGRGLRGTITGPNAGFSLD